jgi:hypothetical protein
MKNYHVDDGEVKSFYSLAKFNVLNVYRNYLNVSVDGCA